MDYKILNSKTTSLTMCREKRIFSRGLRAEGGSADLKMVWGCKVCLVTSSRD